MSPPAMTYMPPQPSGAPPQSRDGGYFRPHYPPPQGQPYSVPPPGQFYRHPGAPPMAPPQMYADGSYYSRQGILHGMEMLTLR